MSVNEDVLASLKQELLGGARPSRPETTPDSSVLDFTRFPGHGRIGEMRAFYDAPDRQNPYFMPRQGYIADKVTVGDRDYTTYSGYNYLGLSCDSRVIAAARDAVERYGTAAGAARIVGGEIELHRELEQELAETFGFEDCVASIGGYVVNMMTIGYLCGPRDLILHDEYMHNSAVMGAVLSGARRVPFPHNDYAALERQLDKLRNQHERVLIVVEGAYSMDGDIPDLARLIDIKKRHRAWLMVDEAHSYGVVGATGRGAAEHCNVDPREIDISMGTLSKSFASCGGFIGGSADLIDLLRYFAPGLLLYSTGMPPANAAAALTALRIMRQEPERVRRLQANAARFAELARQAGLDVGISGDTAVVPIMLGTSANALQLMSDLLDAGIIVHALMHPVVPHDQARLRFFITSSHSEEELDYTVKQLSRLLAS